jgi:hypothetical protein
MLPESVGPFQIVINLRTTDKMISHQIEYATYPHTIARALTLLTVSIIGDDLDAAIRALSSCKTHTEMSFLNFVVLAVIQKRKRTEHLRTPVMNPQPKSINQSINK